MSGSGTNCEQRGYVVTNATVGTVVLNVAANDADEMFNAEIAYSLSSNSLFHIDAESGVITLNSTLTAQVIAYSWVHLGFEIKHNTCN